MTDRKIDQQTYSLDTTQQQRKSLPEQEPVEYWTVADGWVSEQPEQEPLQEPVACQHKRYSIAVHEQVGNCLDCGAEGRMRFIVGEPTQPQRKPDHIVDTNKMVPFQDLAAELFVVAQISPADDGFSDTITRIEAWLRNHFSTPPQRTWVGLTDEEIEDIEITWEATQEWACFRYAVRAIEAKLKEKNNG